uniref:Synaptobrevin, longin-like domain protein n=1 Tax=Tanacetum cinerariifolium TaxID=118510 RepID=A0A6L2N110_TANCI|nr:hypothetical protein [Tanacetum cinerariifolium]
MALTFADTHNMITYLTKSDASEGFDQIIDFLNISSIKYALIVNPNIYVSCIKQFWSSFLMKKVNDVTRLQALVDKKKVIITKATIREALRLDDAESIDCLPNEEIFTELSRMGYEKPSTKLTFYKAFFLPQWKFLIHTILQCMIAKRTSWNEFSSSMASVVICLSTGRKFNFSKYIFDSLVRNVDSSTKFYMYPRFLQLMIRAQVGDLSFYTTKYSSPALTKMVFTNMRRVGKGFFVVDTPLFKGMVKKLERKNKLKVYGLRRLKKVGTAQRVESSGDTVMDDVSKQGEIIANMDVDEDVTLKDVAVVAKEVAVEKDAEIEENADVQGRPEESQAQIYKIDLEHADKVLSMQDDNAARRRKLIRDLEEAATPSIIIHCKPKSKDKGKGILVEEPKPLNKQAQIEQDEAYCREKRKKDNDVVRYQALKRKPQTKAQARKNMMIYVRNMAGFKMDYFKEMSYDKIHPIFETYFNSNVDFLEKTKEQLEEEKSRALKRKTKSSKGKATKKQKLDEEVEELKKHLQIVPNDEDDVYTEATPLTRKVLVVD